MLAWALGGYGRERGHWVGARANVGVGVGVGAGASVGVGTSMGTGAGARRWVDKVESMRARGRWIQSTAT